MQALQKRYEESVAKGLQRRDRELAREMWKRDLSGRTNGTIDTWVCCCHESLGIEVTQWFRPQYGCFQWDMLMDYAVNFTYPWSKHDSPRPAVTLTT